MQNEQYSALVVLISMGQPRDGPHLLASKPGLWSEVHINFLYTYVNQLPSTIDQHTHMYLTSTRLGIKLHNFKEKCHTFVYGRYVGCGQHLLISNLVDWMLP